MVLVSICCNYGESCLCRDGHQVSPETRETLSKSTIRISTLHSTCSKAISCWLFSSIERKIKARCWSSSSLLEPFTNHQIQEIFGIRNPISLSSNLYFNSRAATIFTFKSSEAILWSKARRIWNLFRGNDEWREASPICIDSSRF